MNSVPAVILVAALRMRGYKRAGALDKAHLLSQMDDLYVAPFAL